MAAEASSSRRNGKAASCEPCRKRKIRCDHQRPICARCRQRGFERQCFYHPAPLTRAENLHSSSSAGESSVPTADVSIDTISTPWQHQTAALLKTAAPSPHAASPFSPVSGRREDSNGLGTSAQVIQTIVAQLRHISVIQTILSGYYAATASALVPGALLLPATSDLHDRWSQLSDKSELSRSITEEIVLSTTTTMDLSSVTNASDFCSLHHGKNLRLEILGLLCTIAARASLYGLANDDQNRDAFVQDMFLCSNDALRTARDMIPEMTDAFVWLQYENLLLTVALRGTTDYASWHRLGELASDVVGLDLHRDSSCSSIPFFLAECRRRTFAATYHMDKLIATQVNRPPRLLKRYSDCKMPLDLTDPELLTEDSLELSRLQQSLTSAGWSTRGTYSSSTWARLRFIAATFREEVLEYTFLPSTPENTERLKNLSQRSREQFDALPAHLRYSPECWDSGLADIFSFMLATTYLTYRQIDYQIFRLLEKTDPDSLSPLLQVSDDIVTTVLHVGNLRTRASFLAHDFELLILVYGLPSAVTLASALERSDLTRAPRLPSSLSRSALIRNLAVFVSMLESLHGLAGTKKALRIESVRLLSRTLDKALETPGNPEHAAGESGPISQLHYSSVRSGEVAASPLSSMDIPIPGYDAQAPNESDLLELSHWVENIDWANIGSDLMNL